MFKKAVEAKSQQRLSGADRKKLKRAIKERFPTASDADIDVLLPPKVTLLLFIFIVFCSSWVVWIFFFCFVFRNCFWGYIFNCVMSDDSLCLILICLVCVWPELMKCQATSDCRIYFFHGNDFSGLDVFFLQSCFLYREEFMYFICVHQEFKITERLYLLKPAAGSTQWAIKQVELHLWVKLGAGIDWGKLHFSELHLKIFIY